MRESLLEILVDPVTRSPLHVEMSTSGSGAEVIEGLLRSEDGRTFPVTNGIPRFVLTNDANQQQTSQSFGFKWKKRDTYDSPAMKSVTADWLANKYGFDSPSDWATYYAARERILDVGCGGGLSSSLWLDSTHWTGQAMWVGADISPAVDVAQDRLDHVPNTHFVQADALQLPFADECFDTIFSEGVLHHTPSTRTALLSAGRVLARSGEFHFYVYRRKGPIREFTDDYVREAIAPLSDEEAWEAMRSFTRLGKALTELRQEVTVEDLPLLGIKAGKHDIQRLIYWNFAKLYWNESLSFEENVHINFDWYRPRYAHRQTAEELYQWCSEANLAIKWFHEQESGFTVRAIKE